MFLNIQPFKIVYTVFSKSEGGKENKTTKYAATFDPLRFFDAWLAYIFGVNCFFPAL